MNEYNPEFAKQKIIKRVGPEEYPRYVLVQGNKYYSEMFFPDGSRSNGWEEAFEDALWFASWKDAINKVS